MDTPSITDPAEGSRPFAFRSTAQAAAEWLQDAIMRGDLKPGERLVEHKLARSLGIGQPTLREALRELELHGFVHKIPKRGTFVTKLTQEDFRNIHEVRMALEAIAVERAAVRMTDEGERELTQRVDAMEEAAKRFDLADFHKNDVAFHRLLWTIADNEFLGRALERVVFGLFAFIILQRDETASFEFLEAVKQHRTILEGVLSRDPQVACEKFVDSSLRFWKEHHGLDIEATRIFQERLRAPLRALGA